MRSQLRAPSRQREPSHASVCIVHVALHEPFALEDRRYVARADGVDRQPAREATLVNTGRFVDRSQRGELERRESFRLRHLGKDAQADLVKAARQVRGNAMHMRDPSQRPLGLSWKSAAGADLDQPIERVVFRAL